MKHFFLCLFMLIMHNGFSQIPQVTTGTLKHFPDFPSQYVNPRNVDVWLPEGYNPGDQYSVLYMHDGQMLFDSSITWNGQAWHVAETMEKLLKNKSIQKTIVVGIWNDGDYRRSDYLPGKALDLMSKELADSIVASRLMGRSRSDGYLKFMVNELKPFIDSAFSTIPDPDHTFVLGSSMGGLISMYAICEYHAIFGGAACLSTHWFGEPVSWNIAVPGAYLAYLAENLPDPAHHKLYFDHGTETLDAYYAPFQTKADSIIRNAGYDKANFLTLTFKGDAHTEDAWAKRLETPLLFLLKNN